MIRSLISLLIYLSFNSLLGQSAWVQPKGKTYLQFSATGIFNYDSQFLDGTEEYKLHTEGTDLTFQLYSEYGLTEKTTLFAMLPLKYLDFKETDIKALISDLSNPSGVIYDSGYIQLAKGGQLVGLSNIEIGLRRLFHKKNFSITGQLSVMANSIKVDANKGLRTGYDAMIVKPGISIGYGKAAYFSQGFLGYEYFNNDYSDRIKVYLEAGIKFKKKFWLIGYMDLLTSLENGDRSEFSLVWAGLYLNDQEYIGLGLKFIYEIKDNIGITFNSGGAISANHLPKAPAITFGSFIKF